MKQQELIKNILAGKIFIYPTDTIYGLGCNALDEKAVKRIKQIKQRDKDKPLSIIAPSIDWIKQNCIIDKELDINKYLPGPYTIVLKKKNPEFLRHVSNSKTLGIRIPDSDFTRQIQKAGVPFITTSVNLSGQSFAISINEISKEIINKVDYVINAEDESKLTGKPSTLIINRKEVRR